VTFNERMDATTITTSTILVTVGGSPVAGSVSYVDNTATFTPTSALGSQTTYTVTVTTGVKDVSGNALGSAYSWTFTTAGSSGQHYRDPVLTPTSVFLYGTLTVNGLPLQPGDEVAAYSVHPKPGAVGKWEKVVAGHVVVDTASQLLTIPVYGDDPYSTGIVEGPVSGEEICLVLWRASEGREYTAYATAAGDPRSVFWTANLDEILLDLDFRDGQRIPLRTGEWNLFSYGVLKGYYKGTLPSTPQLSGSSWDNVALLGDALPLRSIEGRYSRIIGNDGSGAKLWNPLMPAVSTLSSLAPGYGYWVKMQPGTVPLVWMTFIGSPPAGNETLSLSVGWTLAGYWGRSAVFFESGYDASGGLFPVDVSDNVALGTMVDLWDAMQTAAVRFQSFDGTGAKILNPSLPQFSTLKYMGPGYGYWIKTVGSTGLKYPKPGQPVGVTATPGNESVTVSWKAVPGATSYNIYWSASPDVTGMTGSLLAGVTSPYAHTGLTAGTACYYVVTAVVSGTEGPESFIVGAVPTSSLLPPTVATAAPALVGTTDAVLSGTVNPNGVATTAWFEWGTDPTLSLYNSTSVQALGGGSSDLSVTAPIGSLMPGETYYCRVVASNAGGTQRGSIRNFTALATSLVVTVGASTVTAISATLNGSVNPTGLMTYAWFEWGTDPTLMSYTSTPLQTVGAQLTPQAVSAAIDGLSPGTTYYFRFGAQRSGITSWGSILGFTTDNAVLRPLVVSTYRETSPTWSPDGSRIVYLSNRNGNKPRVNNLWAINVDGTGEQQLTDVVVSTTDTWGDSGLGARPFWIGGSGDILMLETQYYHELMRFGLAAATPLPVNRTVLDGNSLFFTRLLLVPGGTGLYSYDVTRDGGSAAWTYQAGSGYPSQIRMGPLAGLSGSTNTAGSLVFQTPSGGSTYGMTFSPDGSKLCVAVDMDGGGSTEKYELYVVDLPAGTYTKITSDGGAGISSVQPAWSSDNVIAYVAIPNTGPYELRTIHADGTNKTTHPVTADTVGEPTWSPDGRRIAFSLVHSGDSDIYVMDVR